MKVCITSDVFLPEVGGIQVFTYELAKHLSLLDFVEVSVITFWDGKTVYEKINEKFSVVRLPKHDFVRRGIYLLRRLLEKRNYDVFHSTTLGFSSFVTAYFSKLYRKKSFVTIYGLDALQGYKIAKSRFLIKRTFNNVHHIISFSESTKLKVKDTYKLSDHKLTTIYPGVSVPKIPQNLIEDLRQKLNLSKEDFVVLFVGRLIKRKGADDLIRAISMIQDNSVKLVVVGDGPEKESLIELTNNLKIKDRVIFVGKVSYWDVFKFYKLADVFCMPSKYLKDEGDIEGLGIVFLEAQMYGVPVIGTNSGGIPEAIDNGKSGFIVPENDPKSIADKIMMLKNDAELRERMSKQAIRFVKKKFSWRNCVSKHLQLYEG